MADWAIGIGSVNRVVRVGSPTITNVETRRLPGKPYALSVARHAWVETTKIGAGAGEQECDISRLTTYITPTWNTLAIHYLATSPEVASWLAAHDPRLGRALRHRPTIASRVENIFAQIGTPGDKSTRVKGEMDRRWVLAAAGGLLASFGVFSGGAEGAPLVITLGGAAITAAIGAHLFARRERRDLSVLEGVLNCAQEHLPLFFAVPGHEECYRDFLTRFVPTQLRLLMAPIETEKANAAAMLAALRAQLPAIFVTDSEQSREAIRLLDEAQSRLEAAEANAFMPIAELITRFERSGPSVDRMIRARRELTDTQAFVAQLQDLMRDTERIQGVAETAVATVSVLTSSVLAIAQQVGPMHQVLLDDSRMAGSQLDAETATGLAVPAEVRAGLAAVSEDLAEEAIASDVDKMSE